MHIEMTEEYVQILEAEVEALRTRLQHVMRWTYRNHALQDISSETVDLMIQTYIASYEAEQDKLPREV